MILERFETFRIAFDDGVLDDILRLLPDQDNQELLEAMDNFLVTSDERMAALLGLRECIADDLRGDKRTHFYVRSWKLRAGTLRAIIRAWAEEVSAAFPVIP